MTTAPETTSPLEQLNIRQKSDRIWRGKEDITRPLSQSISGKND